MAQNTALYETHQRCGGRIVEFAGWNLPVQYAGVLAEHRAVRQAAGLFDVSHMGEILFTGPQALRSILYLITNDISKMKDGDVRYSPMCNEAGGTVDDVLVYREGELTGTRLVWVDREGRETPVIDAVADYRDTAISPDGTRLAYDMAEAGNAVFANLALLFATIFRNPLGGFAVALAMWCLDFSLGYGIHPLLSSQGLSAHVDADPLSTFWPSSKAVQLVAGTLLWFVHLRQLPRLCRPPERKDVLRMVTVTAAVSVVLPSLIV